MPSYLRNVATNLAARRLRLLFVADEIPDSLERVVTYLNEQMPNIEVPAVEIKQFSGGSFQTLVPRVIGRTAALEDSSSSGPGPGASLIWGGNSLAGNRRQRWLKLFTGFGRDAVQAPGLALPWWGPSVGEGAKAGTLHSVQP